MTIGKIRQSWIRFMDYINANILIMIYYSFAKCWGKQSKMYKGALSVLFHTAAYESKIIFKIVNLMHCFIWRCRKTKQPFFITWILM